MRPLPSAPVFTRADLRAHGWSDSSISRALRDGRLMLLRRGYVCRPGDDVAACLARAAVSDVRGSVLSHRSALAFHGLPVIGGRPPAPEITVAPTARGDARAALLHRATLPDGDVVMVDGMAVTSAARTVVDVARSRPLVTGVAAMDAALHLGLASSADIDDVTQRCWNWPGIARAQRCVRAADGRAESALESVSRLVMDSLGLPAPLLQPLARDDGGVVLARLDFYWDDVGVAGEADGRSKYTDHDVLVAEKERQEALEDAGVVIARWGWTEAWTHPQRLRAKVRAAFARGAARDRSGFPRGWSISPAKPVTGREKPIDGR